jgi:YgiT-type zinc finger domain-containing protein
MKCTICGVGKISPGTTTVTLERGGTVVVVRNVPAETCDSCGEYYLEGEIVDRLMDSAERAFKSGAEVEVIRYAA